MIRLFAITDSQRFPDFLERSEELCRRARAGSVAVVLRERAVTAAQLLKWARTLRELTRQWGQMLYVADRADVARVSDADGVHLPAAGLAPGAITGSLSVSRGVHELERLSDEDWRRLSAVWVSPVFAERKGRAALGTEGLRERVTALKSRAPHLNVYALGGVTGDGVIACLGAGVDGVAAIGSVWDRAEQGRLVRALGTQR